MHRISVLSPCYRAWLAWTYDTKLMTKSVAAEEFLLISPNKQSVSMPFDVTSKHARQSMANWQWATVLYVKRLEDNASTHEAFSKGRARPYIFNILLRRRTALEISSECRLVIAWLGARRMPMDKLSRKEL